MRSLFIVCAKLMGIYLLIMDVSSIIQLLTGILFQSIMITENVFANLNSQIVFLFGIPFVFHFITGIVLLFFSEAVATFLRIPDTPLPQVDSIQSYLQTGLILLGIYGILLSIQPISNLAMTYFGHYPHINSTSVRFDWQGFCSQSIRIMLSGVLIFASDFISAWLIKKSVTSSSV